jgi:hypothetical protein
MQKSRKNNADRKLQTEAPKPRGRHSKKKPKIAHQVGFEHERVLELALGQRLRCEKDNRGHEPVNRRQAVQ